MRLPEPKVAVVVPAYGVERWVGAAIESVLAQELPVQLIVVDDASPDGTAERARLAMAGRPACTLVPNHRAKGVSGARNAGLDYVEAPWVLFLDGDDVLRSGALAALLAVSAGHVGVLGRFASIGEAGEPCSSSWEREQAASLDLLGRPLQLGPRELARANAMPPPGAQLLATEAVRRCGGFDEQVFATGGSEDAEMLSRLAALGSLAVLNEPVLDYRIRGGSGSTRRDRSRWRVRSRLSTLRRAPRDQRPGIGLAFSARYLGHAGRRLAEGLRRADLRTLLNGSADLLLALLFAAAGLVFLAWPSWRAGWDLGGRP